MTSSLGSNLRSRLPYRLCLLVSLWLHAAGGAIVYSQDVPVRSIHLLESEKHRDMVVPPALAPQAVAPLGPRAAPNPIRTVFGFYPYWTSGFSQIRFQDLTHLAVFSVEADGSGRLVNLRGWPNVPLITAAHQANVRVVLVCTLFSSSQLQALLSSPAARETLIGNLRDQVVLGGADGVNIDFEGVPASQKNNLVLFMRDLATAMRAAVPGAHISIDSPAVDWSQAWDYPALADICDALMIMAYDFHWSGSDPGPVAPLGGSDLWGKYSVRWTIADYISKVGSERSARLIIGVPYYGYDYPSESDLPGARRLPPNATAKSKTYSAAAGEASLYGRRWDGFSSTPWYAYTEATPHQVWYEDRDSLALKYDLIFQNGLQGIGIWALGYDGSRTELWKLIEDRFLPPTAPEAPEITAPAAFFDTAGLPMALQARGSVQSAGFEVAVGSSPGTADLSGFQPVGLRRQVLFRGLALQSGRTYHVSARARAQDGTLSATSASTPITIDASQPPTRKYLPRWVSSEDLYTGMALVNSLAAPRAVLIRGHVSGAADPIVTSWVLKPGEQLAQLVSQAELLGPAVVGKEGWLEVLYQGDSPPGMHFVGDTQASRLLAGSPLIGSASSQVLPILDGGAAQVFVANPSAQKVDLVVGLKGNSPAPASVSRTLAAGETIASKISDFFPGVLDGSATGAAISFQPFATFESDQPLVCLSWLQRDRDAAAVPAQPAGSAVRSGWFSYFAVGGGYRSQGYLVNPANETQLVELRFLGKSAGSAYSASIPPLSAVSFDPAKLSGFAGGPSGTEIATGAVQVDVASGSGVLGAIRISSTDDKLMAALPLEAQGNRSFTFPHLAQAQGYWTGLSLANPGSSPLDATIEVFDTAGTSLGSKVVSLAGGEIRVGLIFQWIPATLGVSSGRVEVRSAGQILAAEIFGSDRLSFMAAVPGR